MITIYSEGNITNESWDYPIDELEYLLEEHNGESFVLIDNRLYELGKDDE